MSDTPVYRHGQFVWREIMTPNVESTLRFYGELFGWKHETSKMPDGSSYTMFKVGEKPVGGCMQLPMPEIPPHWALYVSVDDVVATAAKAKKSGGQVLYGPEDAGGFHLTAPTVFRMAGQLVVIHVHWLAGLPEKAVEVWVRDHQMSHRRPSRDPGRVAVTMALRAARGASRHPGMLRVEYEATVEGGDVVGRTVTYADFSRHADALERARHTLQEGGLWMAA